jgi:hypothetical protein
MEFVTAPPPCLRLLKVNERDKFDEFTLSDGNVYVGDYSENYYEPVWFYVT